MNQIFDYETVLHGAVPRRANVCLHYGPDSKLRWEHLTEALEPKGRLRLGFARWPMGFPWVRCRLVPQLPVLPLPSPDYFAVVPEFYDHSIISRNVAAAFGLAVTPIAHIQFGVPLADIAGLVAPSITTTGIAHAGVEFPDWRGVEPTPGLGRRFAFHVSDQVGQGFAILGRNVLNHLLVLYRGHSYEGLPEGAPAQLSGQVFLGADSP